LRLNDRRGTKKTTYLLRKLTWLVHMETIFG
jgi:hypothetical protein